MQNAARAEGQKSTEKDSSAAPVSAVLVQDDSRWELSTAVKEGWGSSQPGPSSKTVVHESSYLPFLFSGGEAPSPPAKLRGRRTWNKKGQEVIAEDKPAQSEEELKSPPKLDKLSSISGTASSYIAPVVKSSPRPLKTKHSSRSALQAISQPGRVGVDLRASKTATVSAVPSASRAASASSGAPGAFLKPAGVDMPSAKTEPSFASLDDTKGARAEKRQLDGAAGAEKKHKRKKKVDVDASEE